MERREAHRSGRWRATLPAGIPPECVQDLARYCRMQELEGDTNLGHCSVCMEDMVVGEWIVRMPCLHVFHLECVGRWMAAGRARSYCFLCRTSFQRAASAAGELTASGP